MLLGRPQTGSSQLPSLGLGLSARQGFEEPCGVRGVRCRVGVGGRSSGAQGVLAALLRCARGRPRGRPWWMGVFRGLPGRDGLRSCHPGAAPFFTSGLQAAPRASARGWGGGLAPERGPAEASYAAPSLC